MRIIYSRWWIISAALFAATSALAEERLFDKTFAATPGGALGGTLIVEIDTGSVVVSGSDANEVAVHAVLSGDRSLIDQVEISAESTNDGVTVRGRRPNYNWLDLSWMFGGGLDLSYTIHVPRNYRVQVRSWRGDIELRDFNGNAYGHTARGDVLVTGINGEIQVDSSRGSIRGKQLTGSVSATTARGDIELRKVDGRVDARTARGNVEAELIGINRGVDLRTARGDVIVKLSKEFAADLDAHTDRGDVECNLPVTTREDAPDRYRHVLNGALNGGGKPLVVRTSRGDIEIRSAL